jgi:hypothetical protein
MSAVASASSSPIPAELNREAILEQLRGRFVCSVDEARVLLDLGRVAAYRLAATGQLADGVPVLHCGRSYKVPVAKLMRAVIGDEDADDQGEG